MLEFSLAKVEGMRLAGDVEGAKESLAFFKGLDQWRLLGKD